MTIGAQRPAGAAPCNTCSDPADPTTLSDVFSRIGGPHVGRATLGLVVNSNNVVLDDIWAWRADHGVAGSVGWSVNPSETGLLVDGDSVTATGLFVKHFEMYNVIWKRAERQDGVLPERAALRPAEPGRLVACRSTRLGRWEKWPTR